MNYLFVGMVAWMSPQQDPLFEKLWLENGGMISKDPSHKSIKYYFANDYNSVPKDISATYLIFHPEWISQSLKKERRLPLGQFIVNDLPNQPPIPIEE